MSNARKIRRAQKAKLSKLGGVENTLKQAVEQLPGLQAGLGGLEEIQHDLATALSTLRHLEVELEIQRLTNILMARAILNCSDEEAREIETQCRTAALKRLASDEEL